MESASRSLIIDHEKRFARVRTASCIEGWVEQRYLIDQKTFDGFEQLTQQNQNAPVEAPGVLRNETNLLTPGRETEDLYQLASGAMVAILKRAVADKATGASPVRPIATKAGPKGLPGPVLEDWWLVRDDQRHVGRVLARMVDIDVPLENHPNTPRADASTPFSP